MAFAILIAGCQTAQPPVTQTAQTPPPNTSPDLSQCISREDRKEWEMCEKKNPQQCRMKIAAKLKGEIDLLTLLQSEEVLSSERKVGLLRMVGTVVAARGGSFDKENVATGLLVVEGVSSIFGIGKNPEKIHSSDIWRLITAELRRKPYEYPIEALCADLVRYRERKQEER